MTANADPGDADQDPHWFVSLDTDPHIGSTCFIQIRIETNANTEKHIFKRSWSPLKDDGVQ